MSEEAKTEEVKEKEEAAQAAEKKPAESGESDQNAKDTNGSSEPKKKIDNPQLKKIVDELTYPGTDEVKAGIGVAIHLTMLGIKKDLRIIEIPITFNKRRGESKIGSNRRIRAIKIGLTFLWLILKT